MFALHLNPPKTEALFLPPTGQTSSSPMACSPAGTTSSGVQFLRTSVRTWCRLPRSGAESLHEVTYGGVELWPFLHRSLAAEPSSLSGRGLNQNCGGKKTPIVWRTYLNSGLRVYIFTLNNDVYFWRIALFGAFHTGSSSCWFSKPIRR